MKTYEHTITYRDYLDAQRLYLRHRRWTKIVLYLSFGALPFFVLAMSAFGLYGMHERGEEITFSTVVSFCWAGFLLPIFFILLRRWSMKRTFRALLAKGEKTSTTAIFGFDEDGLESALPGRNEGRYFWKGLLDYAEDANVALFFPRKNFFLFVPKRTMPDDEWTKLRVLVKQNVKPVSKT